MSRRPYRPSLENLEKREVFSASPLDAAFPRLDSQLAGSSHGETLPMEEVSINFAGRTRGLIDTSTGDNGGTNGLKAAPHSGPSVIEATNNLLLGRGDGTFVDNIIFDRTTQPAAAHDALFEEAGMRLLGVNYLLTGAASADVDASNRDGFFDIMQTGGPTYVNRMVIMPDPGILEDFVNPEQIAGTYNSGTGVLTIASQSEASTFADQHYPLAKVQPHGMVIMPDPGFQLESYEGMFGTIVADIHSFNIDVDTNEGVVTLKGAATQSVTEIAGGSHSGGNRRLSAVQEHSSRVASQIQVERNQDIEVENDETHWVRRNLGLTIE